MNEGRNCSPPKHQFVADAMNYRPKNTKGNALFLLLFSICVRGGSRERGGVVEEQSILILIIILLILLLMELCMDFQWVWGMKFDDDDLKVTWYLSASLSLGYWAKLRRGTLYSLGSFCFHWRVNHEEEEGGAGTDYKPSNHGKVTLMLQRRDVGSSSKSFSFLPNNGGEFISQKSFDYVALG